MLKLLLLLPCVLATPVPHPYHLNDVTNVTSNTIQLGGNTFASAELFFGASNDNTRINLDLALNESETVLAESSAFPYAVVCNADTNCTKDVSAPIDSSSLYTKYTYNKGTAYLRPTKDAFDVATTTPLNVHLMQSKNTWKTELSLIHI